MSENEYTIEDEVTFDVYKYTLESFIRLGVEDRFGHEILDQALSELRSLRAAQKRQKKLERCLELALQRMIKAEAEAEAWRAVREVFTRDNDGFDLDSLRDELHRQIARLDAMKEGESK